MQALCNLVTAYGPVVGRIMITPLFLMSGYGKITGFAGTAANMGNAGLPFPEFLLVGAIAFELAGGLMVLLGWRARFGALLLAVFTIAATLVFHNFWAVEAAQFRGQLSQFMKNLAILGGLVYIMVAGSGPFSLGKEGKSASAR
ncbi:MAG TPA: DoxX family protein [Burkholderiales bacterium]|nr:DoxX family protein [Burkholderiales bacterium]